ncbi:C-terminal binding protein [Roseibium aggregatum]|uniref:C-terminal binding protein n=1 Tax=Roseibium aggregatum TaxID=187304 RepID=A0A939EEX1_9HYPH|nr:C-terminal binding protein [Roseibium aggregatum]MBN9671539.1 C-terminal binding protein [Roseibium aggregatum]
MRAETASSMETPLVAVLEPGYADYMPEQEAIRPFGARVLAVPAEEDAVSALADKNVFAVLIRERRVDAALYDRFPGLKLILRYGVGVDNVDLDKARERGIYVANIPDYGAENEVSDHAVALYLAVARRVVARDGEVRQGKWGIGQLSPIPGHRNATLGLIGFGRIARAACERFRALGFSRVLVSDPNLDGRTTETFGVEAAAIDDLCRTADVVSLHAPLTAQTRNIIDARRIALMKKSAILVNVSRGGLVDETALAAALREKRIFGAGIDVFETEPPASDNPLLSSPNTVLSDHCGWYSEASVGELQRRAGAELARVLAGSPPQNWVNQW